MEQRRLDRVLANTRPTLRALYSTLSETERVEVSKQLYARLSNDKADEDVLVHCIVLIRERGHVMTYKEIGEKLGLHPCIVKRTYNDAMKKIQRLIADLGYTELDFI